MTPAPNAPHHNLAKLLIAGALIAANASPVHASYTVIEEDLYPTSYIEARKKGLDQPEQKATTPFARQRAVLGKAGKASLDALIPRMRNASIRIIGRPDATASQSEQSLAGDRAISIRDYLVENGIPFNSIKMETDESPNPPRGGVFHTDIHITTFAPPPPAVAYAQQETPAYPGTQYSANQAPTSAPQTSTASTELIRHINHAVQTGQMSPAVAVQLLANLAPKAPPQWEILETDQTLQNTFVRWGKTANWEVKWQNVPDIKNPGHVVLPDGDFLTTASGVLKQAQKATQAAGFDLDIIAYPNRVLVISKANIK